MREYVLKCKVEEVEKVMSDFINSIRCLMFEDKGFATFEIAKMDGFCAVISSMYLMEDTCKIGYNLSELTDSGMKLFRRNLEERFPSARGFANITWALLHEMGHFCTDIFVEENFDEREKMKEEVRQIADYVERQNAYFDLPTERLATNWAIRWMLTGNNSRKAKEFEKKFFACFE